MRDQLHTPAAATVTERRTAGTLSEPAPRWVKLPKGALLVVREADEKEVEEEGEESQSQRPGRPGRPLSPLTPFSPARKRPERNRSV